MSWYVNKKRQKENGPFTKMIEFLHEKNIYIECSVVE